MVVVEDEQAIGELIASATCDERGYCAIHVQEPAAAIATTGQVTLT